MRSTVGAALLTVVLFAACAGDGERVRAEIGKPAPTFETFDLAGERVALDDFDDEIGLINFWASWCVPCRKEFPVLHALNERDDVTVVGVVFDDTEDKARKFMTDHDATWPGLVDDGSLAKAYGVGRRPGIPVTFALDREGVIRAKHLGEADRKDLEALVDAAEA